MFLVSEREEFGLLDKIVFAHEYTHALQDQHFDLSSLPLDLEGNSDIALAALALVEGDAVLSMDNYMMENLDLDALLAILQEAEEVDQGELDSAPQFIQEELLFPYEAGLEFVSELDQWGGINAAYADLPESTEQIMHPEKYLERDSPQEVSMPDLAPALGEEWSQLDSDTLGELYVGIYLDTYIADVAADTAAAGWDGDRYIYLKSTEGRKCSPGAPPGTASPIPASSSMRMSPTSQRRARAPGICVSRMTRPDCGVRMDRASIWARAEATRWLSLHPMRLQL